MIQILSIREYHDAKSGRMKKAERWFEKGLRAATVEEIFLNPDAYLAGVPESERYNVYFTVSECLEEPGRKLLAQHHIPFDIDKIDPDKVVDEKYQLEVAQVVCQALGVPFEKTGIVFSGNGLQFFVGVKNPIVEVDEFDKQRGYYKIMCDKINIELRKAKLTGVSDPSVWSPARLMRYPNTRNVKPEKETRLSKVIQANIERIDFTLEKASGVVIPLPEDCVADSITRRFPTPDVKTIMEECNFLRWMQAEPEKVTEPQWYAGLSVTARFPNGREFSHKISQGHPGYSYDETELKIDQAIQNASGPRTCASFDKLADKCKGCKHFGDKKLLTPLFIKGEDHVATAHSGFRFINANGKPGAIDFQGLRNQFNRDYSYKAVENTGIVYVFNGTHFKELSRERISDYMHTRVVPPSTSSQWSEFRSLVTIKNLVDVEWFNSSTRGKLNFQNGVLDIDSGVLLPHTTEFGFRSVLACDYEKDAQCPTWLKFIDEVTCGREDLAHILQEYLGYTFANNGCGRTKALALVGDGSNGKSTFVRVVRELCGGQGASNLSIKSLSDPQNRYLLEGKMVNIAEENSYDAFKDSELVKNLVDGGMMTVKKLFAQPYEFRNQAKFIMLYNEAPRTRDTTHGFMRRLLFVPFDRMFTEEESDIGMTDKLIKELPGITNWILEGYKRLQEQGGFTKSAASKEMLDEYSEEASEVNAWFAEEVDVIDSEEPAVVKEELYNNFNQWCLRSGYRNPPNMSYFMRSVRSLLKVKHSKDIKKFEVRARVGEAGARTRMLRWVKLRPAEM